MQLPYHTQPTRRRSQQWNITLLVLVLLTWYFDSTSAQQIRIPLQRRDVPPGQHYRNIHAMAAHAARNFEGPVPHISQHDALALYSDPQRIVQMKNFFNRMYCGTVTVGTPAVTYSLVFDTGSADMWLFAAQNQKATLNYIQYYDASKSSTSQVTTTPWSIQYGKGESEGVLVSDHVTLANLQAKDFLFAQATTYSEDFESPEMPLDGLLGLAFASVNSANGPTLIDALQSAGMIKERVFSFYLSNGNPEGSEFVLGAPDLSVTKGNLTYHDLASTSGMWILAMQAVAIGSTTTNFCSSADCAVLIDTGTSFVGMPSTSFNEFARQVNDARSDCLIDSGSGLIRCDRNTADGLPSISFSIQGSLFTLDGSDYFQGGILGFMSIDVSTSSGKSNFWILGDTFLIKHYTVYDMDNKKIGIVGAKPGVPYTAPTEDSPYRTLSWQLVTLIVGLFLGVVCLSACCVKAGCHRRAATPRSRSPAPAPYLLQQQPPRFQAEESQPQFAPYAAPQSAPYHASQYPGYAGRGAPAIAFGEPLSAVYAQARPPPPVQFHHPHQMPQSEFARDFYANNNV